MTLAPYIGHAPDDVRSAFSAAVEDPLEFQSAVDVGDNFEPIEELCELLSECTDVMPPDLCHAWDLPVGSPFKDGAVAVLRRIRS